MGYSLAAWKPLLEKVYMPVGSGKEPSGTSFRFSHLKAKRDRPLFFLPPFPLILPIRLVLPRERVLCKKKNKFEGYGKVSSLPASVSEIPRLHTEGSGLPGFTIILGSPFMALLAIYRVQTDCIKRVYFMSLSSRRPSLTRSSKLTSPASNVKCLLDEHVAFRWNGRRITGR